MRNLITRLITKLRELHRNAGKAQDGFTLIEAIVVIAILIPVLIVTIGPMVTASKAAAEMKVVGGCENQGETAKRLCQIQQDATTFKGTNELAVINRDTVASAINSSYPSTLVWQVGTIKGEGVCVVGYDLSDPTSKFTHDKPFVYAFGYGSKTMGLGCGNYNADGTYAWTNDPTIPKPVYVMPTNQPQPVRVVNSGSDVMNGTIDSFREGETITVVIDEAYASTTLGTERGYITFDANYVCSNGYTRTQSIQADLVRENPKASWKGHLYTYGGSGNDVGLCNPTSVSLLAVTDQRWTLGNTENFTFPGAV